MITKINKASLIIITRHSCCVRPPHEVIMIRLRHAQLGNFAYVNYQLADMQNYFLLSTSVRDDPLNVFFIIANSHPHIVANLRLGQVMFCGIEVHLLSTVYLVSLTNMLNASMYMFK